MSNCLSKNTSVVVLQPKAKNLVNDVAVNNYVLNVDLQFKKVAKIETFKNVDCFEISTSIGEFSRNPVIFSKEHFKEENLQKLKFLALREVVCDVVAFFDNDGNEIETLPIGFIHLFSGLYFSL